MRESEYAANVKFDEVPIIYYYQLATNMLACYIVAMYYSII